MKETTKSPKSKSPRKKKLLVAPPPTEFQKKDLPESAPLSPKSPQRELRPSSGSKVSDKKVNRTPKKSPKKTPKKSPKRSPKKPSSNSSGDLPTLDVEDSRVAPSKKNKPHLKSPQSKSSSPKKTPRKSPKKSPRKKSPGPSSGSSQLPKLDLSANPPAPQSPKAGHISKIVKESDKTTLPTSSGLISDHRKTQGDSSGSQGVPNSSTKVEDAPPLTEEEKKLVLRNAREYLNANIRLISACQDGQQTSDCSNVMMRFGLRNSMRGSQAFGYDGGACTSVLLKTLYEYHKNPKTETAPKWIDLLHMLHNELKDNGYKQVPVLTSSRPVSMKDEFSIIPKNHNGSRKALIIGIRYKGRPWELPGCHNDCYAMISYLKRVHNFTDDDITVLMDDGKHTSPTRDNILKAFHRFSFSLNAGDAAFFHFAGHGSSKPDESGDEKSGYDQTLVPVDVIQQGDIVDDEIFRILLIPLPRGLQLTAIVDCCHSGTIFDLPFEFIGDSRYEDGNEMEFRKVSFPHMNIVRAERNRIRMMTELKERESVIEREIVKPIDTRPKNPFTMAVIQERPNSRRNLKPAVEEPTPQMPEMDKGNTKDNPGLMALGCLLICLNPMKLFR